MSRSKDISHINGKPQFQGPVPLIGQHRQESNQLPIFRMDDDVLSSDFVPTQDNVLIRKVERIEKVGSIVMAAGESKFIWAQVVSVGPGRISDVNHKHIKPQVEAGDVVIVTPLAGLPPVWINCKTEELMLIRDYDIRLKIKRGQIASPAVEPVSTIVTE
jgi:co-chaperonin GroES (HSP10)